VRHDARAVLLKTVAPSASSTGRVRTTSASGLEVRARIAPIMCSAKAAVEPLSMTITPAAATMKP
jgi:hypothetical protein